MRNFKLLLFLTSLFLLFFISCDILDPDNDNKDEEYFPVFEVVSGNGYDLGFAIGERFSYEINQFMLREVDLHNTLCQIVSLDSVYFLQNMLDQATALFPNYVAEIQGTADAAGIDFTDLFILNSFGDIIALYYGSQYFDGNLINSQLVGCSTVTYNFNDIQYLAHNEDCFASLHDLMAVVKVELAGKPDFINFSYPGLLLGIAPSYLDNGLAISNNFIQLVGGDTNGVPHFFLLRYLLEANSIDEIVTMAENTITCDGFHVNVASDQDNTVYSIEKAFGTISVTEVNGLYAHTNHFIHDDMQAFPVSIDDSSICRLDILLDDISTYQNNLQEVNTDLLLDFLCDVAAIPDTTGGATTGMTVGSSIINLESGKWKLYFNDPNDDLYQILKF